MIYDAFLAWDRRQKCKMLAVIVASQPTESSIQYSLRTTTWTIENKHHRTLKKKVGHLVEKKSLKPIWRI